MRRRHWGLLPATLAVACGGTQPHATEPPALPPPPEEVTPGPEEARPAPPLFDEKLAAMLTRVSKARGLDIRQEVASRVLDRESLLEKVRDHVAREVPEPVLRGHEEMLVALGLVPPSFDYQATMYRLLGGQLAGLYEPAEKAMYLAADLGEEAAKATLAHELVHALQDQHWDLAPRLAYAPKAGDATSAVHALAEGDATSAMLDVLLDGVGRTALDISERAFALEAALSAGMDDELAAVPRVLRAALVAPYIDGLAFVNGLRKKGGWALVNDAWSSPPISTEQLLHLDKYEKGEKPEPTRPPLAPEKQGWAVAHEDVLGEQGLRLVLEEGLPPRLAKTAAAGWGGDLVTLYQRSEDGAFALLWMLRFDEGPRADRDAEAREGFDALARQWGKAVKGTRACEEREGHGAIAIMRRGRDVAVAVGPYRRTGDHLSQQAGCAETLRWAGRALTGESP